MQYMALFEPIAARDFQVGISLETQYTVHATAKCAHAKIAM